MTTIEQISKKSLAEFKNKNYIFTPDEYQKVFCKEAKKANIIFEDCNKVANLIQKLDKKYQKMLANYRINTLSELVLFLINNLNRENIDETKAFSNELLTYTKRVLQVIDMFPSKAKYIASKHIDLLKPYLKPDEIAKLRNEWLDFMTTYDDKNFKMYKKRCHLNDDDVLEMLPKLEKCLAKDEDFSELVDAIIFSLTPSYAHFMDDEVAILNKQLKRDSSLITASNMANEIKILTKKRIKKDKDELKKKFVDIDKITETLSRKIVSLLKNSNVSKEEIKIISKDLEKIDTSDKFEIVKEKLVTITIGLDEEIKKFTNDLEKENEEISILRKKIEVLENELQKVKKEAKTDALTNMLNKKALNDELKKQEEFYKRFKRNYSVIFFDIDHFKNVNDTYGHDAGDVILKSVGLILNRYSRDIDIVGRFGGEEFIIIAPETEKEGAYKFADKIRQVIEKTKFMYKKTRIKITISAGVAERKEVNSMEEIVKLADERLYKAKNSGRNRVEVN
jgi:diguanylate cyclase (GGDEF)-like protein